VRPELLVVTFGKAFGVSGAAVLCDEAMADYLLQFARRPRRRRGRHPPATMPRRPAPRREWPPAARCRHLTFGKAFGVSGAAVLCDEAMADYLLQFARHLIYSTVRGAAPASFVADHADAVGVIHQQQCPGGLRRGVNGRQRLPSARPSASAARRCCATKQWPIICCSLPVI
jgi:hypothetical protein